MGPVSEKDMEYTFDCYFRQLWRDERLKFNSHLQSLSLASKMLKDIWRPDTYIRNGRQSYLHTLTTPNILLRVRSNGVVYVSQRCPMFLKKFPMDTQACPLVIGSLGYSSADIVYRWKAVTVNVKELSQFHILKTIIDEANITDIRSPADPPLSTIQAHFILQRQQGYYVLQIYTPCCLIVVMSWVSFWIHKEASPARVGLGIMTVLTMSTLALSGRQELPKISYSTALDLYMVSCFGFVFAALVEYAVINFAHIVYVQKTVQKIRGAKTANMVHRLHQITATMLLANASSAAAKLSTGESPHSSTASASTSLLRQPSSNPIDNLECSPRGTAIMLLANTKPLAAILSTGESPHSSTASGSTSLLRQPSSNPIDNLECSPRGKLAEAESFLRRRSNRSSNLRQMIKERASKKINQARPGIQVDRIDSVAKVMFPALYGLFNVLYWLSFLYWIPNEIDSIPSIRQHVDNDN